MLVWKVNAQLMKKADLHRRTSVRPTVRRGGFAYVLALILLALVVSLAAAFAAEANMSLRKADNQVRVNKARLRAESGIAFFSRTLQDVLLPSGVASQEAIDALASSLASRLDGTANLTGQSVGYDGTQISVPRIIIDENGGGFSAALSLNADETICLVVTGRDGNCTRRVRLDFQVVEEKSFAYGVASRGKVKLTGNAQIKGANDPSEANVLGASYSDPEAAKMTGNCKLDGDLLVSNPSAHVTLTGNISIGGASQASDEIYEHVYIGVGEVEFPEADSSIFESFATNIVDSSTSTSGNKTFVNIRILPGTDPTFAGDIVLKGVVFIETPNKVTFAGSLNIIGVVVTQDAGEGELDDNYVHFTGNTSTSGVEALPDQPEFTGLKALPGTFLLAPGFSVKFTGNFGTVNGAMAAGELNFTGNAGGTVRGPIITWSDTDFEMVGNASLTIDRSGSNELPRGFTAGSKLLPLPGTYEEL